MSRSVGIDRQLFFASVLFTTFVCIVFSLFPDQSSGFLNSIFSTYTGALGSVYLWLVLGSVLLIIFLSCSKYGRIKLGNETDKPDFSTSTWLGMIFTAGTGSSILYWATIEWAMYYRGGVGSTPWGAEPGSWQAGEWATTYGMFHEGVSAWGLYTVFGIAIAYIYHVRKKPVLKISEACRGVLGSRVDGWVGKAVDLFFIFGIIAGTATSLGFGTPMIAEGFSKLTGVERSLTLDMAIIASWVVFIGGTLAAGLEKGLSRVSNLNIYLFYIVLGFIVLVGPTTFMLNTFTSGIGKMLDNFFSMSLWTDSISGDGFPQNWTMFYWAWWLVYGPSSGIFLAKISKGRTIREMAIACTLGGALGCWLIFSILGNYALNLELTGQLAVMQMLDSGADPAQIIIEVINHLPFGSLFVFLFMMLAFVYSATSVNAVAYSVASVTSDALEETRNQPDGTECSGYFSAG